MSHRDSKGRFCKAPEVIPKPVVINTFQFAMDAQFNYTGEQPVICLHFGCGKTLSPRERLFGKLCINHRKPTSFPALIDPYL